MEWPDLKYFWSFWSSDIPVKDAPLIAEIRLLHNQFKSDLISWIKLFIHFDFDFKKKVAMVVKTLNEAGLSYHVICFSIFGLIAMVLCILNYPKYRSLMRARNCKVVVYWNKNNPNRVGGVVQVKISPFLSPTSLGRLDFTNETMTDLITNLHIKVLVDQEEVVVTKEISDVDQSMYAKFPVKVSGKYAIFLTYCGFAVTGSPFTAIMEADEIDISKSYVSVGNPIIVVKNKQFKIDIIPVDMFGNRCPTSLDTMTRLTIDVQRVIKDTSSPDLANNANSSKGRDTNEDDVSKNASNDFRFTTGIRRENPEQSEFLPIYSIYGKCSSVGQYVGRISINDFPLTRPNPFLEFISISKEEDEMMKVMQDSGLCQFEGQLIFQLPTAALPAQDPVTPVTPTTSDHSPTAMEEDVGVWDIAVELTPRFLFFSRRILDGPLVRRLDTWRVGSNTKVEIVSIQHDPEPNTHIMKISNNQSNSFEEVVMKGNDARVLLVMFYETLAAQRNETQAKFVASEESPFLNIENLKLRQKKFYEGIRQSFDNHDCELLLVLPTFKTFTVIRDDIVETTLEATRNFNRNDWGKPFIVSFRHEPVNRSGASCLEWAEELGKELFESSVFGLFLGNGSTIGNRQRPGLLHPNSGRHNRWKLEHYELAGKLVGKCVVENALNPESPKHPVDARFSKTILASILGMLPTSKHMQIDDPDYYQSNFVPVLHNDVSTMGLRFVIHRADDKGEWKIHELVPNGANIVVTNENKITYLNELAKFHLLQNVQAEILAFISGLNFMIPGRLLMMFEENELEILLCGSSQLNLKNLIQYYHGSEINWSGSFDKVTNWLRIALEGMDDIDVGRFYQFVTGSSRLPKDGFVALRPSIGMSALFAQMPSANKSQCHLTVTDHPSYESFLNSLLIAIRKNQFD